MVLNNDPVQFRFCIKTELVAPADKMLKIFATVEHGHFALQV